jgi:hypothetical protein
MNEYYHLSPNVNHYNSNCIKIQKLFQEMLNPQKVFLEMNEFSFNRYFDKDFYSGNVPKEIKRMNPKLETINVALWIGIERKLEDKWFVNTFNDTYPRFFTAIMNSIKDNPVHIPLFLNDSDENNYDSDDDDEHREIDPDLGLTTCDYINLEITQPKKDEKSIRLEIIWRIYNENFFKFTLVLNNLTVAKKIIRLQANENLDIATEVPIQTKIIRVKPTFTAYPDDDVDERQNIQGSKYFDNTTNLIHSTNNTRFAKKTENVSNIPMAFDVEKYKPTLIDNDRVFNQLHNNINRNSQGLPTVKARFQKYVDVTHKNKTKKNKGGKTRKKKAGKRKNKAGKRKKTVIHRM